MEEFERQEVDSSLLTFLFEELFKDNKIDAQVEQSIEQISGAFLIESLGELKVIHRAPHAGSLCGRGNSGKNL